MEKKIVTYLSPADLLLCLRKCFGVGPLSQLKVQRAPRALVSEYGDPWLLKSIIQPRRHLSGASAKLGRMLGQGLKIRTVPDSPGHTVTLALDDLCMLLQPTFLPPTNKAAQGTVN